MRPDARLPSSSPAQVPAAAFWGVSNLPVSWELLSSAFPGEPPLTPARCRHGDCQLTAPNPGSWQKGVQSWGFGCSPPKNLNCLIKETYQLQQPPPEPWLCLYMHLYTHRGPPACRHRDLVPPSHECRQDQAAPAGRVHFIEWGGKPGDWLLPPPSLPTAITASWWRQNPGGAPRIE